MQNIAKSLANNALAALTSRAPQGVVSAIKQASAKTGVNFAYMVQQAAAESSFNPTAKAKTSSASGLYQFIESTWMNMVERHGAKHSIQIEGKSRAEILRLRNDPKIAANMAAEFASENKKILNSNWAKGEKDIGATELYFAHFMGASGASAFLNARDENPLQEAALLFPKAAAANRNVFYDRESGRAKTLEEVYQFFDKKFEIANQANTQIATQDIKAISTTPVHEDIPADVIDTIVQRENSPYLNSLIYQRQEASVLESGFNRSYAPSPYQSLIGNPIELMMLTQLDLPLGQSENPLKAEKKSTELF